MPKPHSREIDTILRDFYKKLQTGEVNEKQLVEQVADLAGWTPNEGRASKVCEFLWEIGLRLQRLGRLSETAFLLYAKSMMKRGCIPVAIRTKQVLFWRYPHKIV